MAIKHLPLFPFRYLFLSASFYQALFPEIICQMIFAPSARFIAANSLTPTPPLSFCLHTMSQLIRWSFLVPLCFPPCQRKHLRSFPMSWIIELGANEMEQVKIGNAARTMLMRVNFLVGLSQIAPKDCILFFIFSTSSFQSDFSFSLCESRF